MGRLLKDNEIYVVYKNRNGLNIDKYHAPTKEGIAVSRGKDYYHAWTQNILFIGEYNYCLDAYSTYKGMECRGS